ncbi:hypothetical protein B0H14DRAFT_2666194 [Mycena olivaceomarginata]|nr:hypothetical protein B0H14DRAFT_2666194 [Mycena olivaceomarginata]
MTPKPLKRGHNTEELPDDGPVKHKKPRPLTKRPRPILSELTARPANSASITSTAAPGANSLNVTATPKTATASALQSISQLMMSTTKSTTSRANLVENPSLLASTEPDPSVPPNEHSPLNSLMSLFGLLEISKIRAETELAHTRRLEAELKLKEIEAKLYKD